MSLIFLESWDGIAQASLGSYFEGKWTADANSYSIRTPGYSGSGYYLYLDLAGEWYKTVPVAHEDSTFIVGVRFLASGTHTERKLIKLMSDARTTLHVYLSTLADGSLHVHQGNGALLGSCAAGTVVPDIWHYVELKAKLHDTTGTVTVRLDDVQVIAETALDTKNGGTKATFDSISLTADWEGAFAAPCSVDDLYLCNGLGVINNDFLGEGIVPALLANADGTFSQLVGSDGNSVENYKLVDETTINDADYAGSATIGNKDTYNFADLTNLGDVAGVQAYVRAAKSDTGAKSGIIVCRLPGVELYSDAFALSTDYGWYGWVFETKPGGGAWALADVNAAEFGFQVA